MLCVPELLRLLVERWVLPSRISWPSWSLLWCVCVFSEWRDCVWSRSCFATNTSKGIEVPHALFDRCDMLRVEARPSVLLYLGCWTGCVLFQPLSPFEFVLGFSTGDDSLTACTDRWPLLLFIALLVISCRMRFSSSADRKDLGLTRPSATAYKST